MAPSKKPIESYAVRESLRRSIGTIIWTLLSSAAPAVIAYAIWSVREELADFPEIGLGLNIVALLMLALCGILLLIVLGLIIRAARRTAVVIVDRRGITLGPEGVAGRFRFYPWAHVVRLRTYTTSSRSGSGEDPPLTYITYLQIDAADGTSERRSTPVGREDWGDLATAMRDVAPEVPIQTDGVLGEGHDPLVGG